MTVSDGRDDTALFCRYESRDVVYLSGERDTKALGNQICNEEGPQETFVMTKSRIAVREASVVKETVMEILLQRRVE